MSRIRGKHTRPEMQIRKLLWHAGFRYRLHGPKLPGRPDVVLPRWRAVILVHGCFWHYHEGCVLFRLPATRTEFWLNKLSGNRERDRRSIRELQERGWRVAIVWECALKVDEARVEQSLTRWLRSDSPAIEVFRDGTEVVNLTASALQ
ncbi:very short patch repair endonuclease [Dyella thiooxydans]|uniref:very short patch repair endonuclease n=1 Tax=Dyella thiooxydans TaxID=445710 RepID=UPI001F0307DE|nr:DNA mismatch endonuclease Vsr [Dyella thiooxydans]